MRKRKKNKVEEFNRRLDAIKSLMSTFAMSTVAVVAVVTLIPSSPKASIVKAEALSEQVVYQVQVTDEDNALDLSTLFVVLENQMEYYEQPISLGENSGFFDDLNNNTDYRLSVYGNKGFGQERLDTMQLTTRPHVGSNILSVAKDGDPFQPTYLVDIQTYDPDGIYSNLTLYYGYTFEPDMPLQYQSVTITNIRETITLSDIFTSNEFHLYIEADTVDGSIILDELWVTPPFVLYDSMYISYVTDDSAHISIYSETDISITSVSYELNIYHNDILINTVEVPPATANYQNIDAVVDDLSPNTTYKIEGIASYIDPQTLRKTNDVIYEETFTTLNSYDITLFNITDQGTFYEVTIILNDPSNYFQLAYFDIYEITDDFDNYITGNSYVFTASQSEKSITFTIDKPTETKYRITIGIRSELNFEIRDIIFINTYE